MSSQTLAKEARRVVEACGGVYAENSQGAPEPRDEHGRAIPGPFECKLPTLTEVAAKCDAQSDLFEAIKMTVRLASPVVPRATVMRWTDGATNELNSVSGLPACVTAQATVQVLEEGLAESLDEITDEMRCSVFNA